MIETNFLHLNIVSILIATFLSLSALPILIDGQLFPAGISTVPVIFGRINELVTMTPTADFMEYSPKPYIRGANTRIVFQAAAGFNCHVHCNVFMVTRIVFVVSTK